MPKKDTGKEEYGEAKEISVKGARTHNLKDIDVSMPRNKMVVITGLSGSGKSSLAFDTIFAEGQRRYVESLSSYARQFLDQMQKPDVDEITGLSPAISIDQKSRSNNPRSTVATITEIYDYLRILYARVGIPYSPTSGKPIERLSHEEIKNIILARVEERVKDLPDDPKDLKDAVDTAKRKHESVSIYSPVVRGRKGEYYQLLYDLLGRGYSRAVIDGEEKSLRDKVVMEKNKTHDIDVLADEIDLRDFKDDSKGAEERLSEAIERSLHESDSLVRVKFFDEEISTKKGETWGSLFSSSFTDPYSGYSFPEIEPRLFSFNSPYGACPECKGLGTLHFHDDNPCSVCEGARLREESLHIYFGESAREDLREKGAHPERGLNIVELIALSVSDAKDFFDSLSLGKKESEISKPILREITERLKFMIDVGIEYLGLDRRANTLSGGEAQRIRLASQLGSGLVGALYVLDEPTIGLHARDNDRLVKTLLNLRDIGNTIIVVEHDEDTIFSADYIVDIGPGAGRHGGEVVVADDIEHLLSLKTNPSGSLTLDYLRGDKEIPVPSKRRTRNKGSIKIAGGKLYNIENLNVEVPLGKFVLITGVSGSGKSTFMYEILHKNMQAKFDRKYRTNEIFNVKSVSGTEYISRAILINQSPIGRTSRSNPATYTKAFDYIRDLFTATKEAKARGWKKGRFSFNVKGGRCEACQGKGDVAVEMHFLPTVYVPCDVCNGKRFTKETLEVEYKDKNIYYVLEMTVEEAVEFFEDIPQVYDRLKTLLDVGLGYLKLGQSATTLSGGEAQRVKIASELYRPNLSKTLYLLDEPTVGLHYEDVRKLIEILDKLVEKGNTVMVIEHNMDVIKCADHIIDFGPEGGDDGGKVVAEGTPEEVAEKGTYTGEYLKSALKRKK